MLEVVFISESALANNARPFVRQMSCTGFAVHAPFVDGATIENIVVVGAEMKFELNVVLDDYDMKRGLYIFLCESIQAFSIISLENEG